MTLLPSKVSNENAWTVEATDIQNFDISAKNPTKHNQVALKSTIELKDLIRTKTDRMSDLVNEVFCGFGRIDTLVVYIEKPPK